MAYLEALPEIASIGSRILGSTVGRVAAKTVATKAVGAVTGGGDDKPGLGQQAANLTTSALNNIHPISNSGPVPGSQPMDQPGYNNLSQAQFQDSVQQQ